MNLWHPAPELNQPDIGLGIPEKGELLAWTIPEIHAFTTFDGKRHRCAALQDAAALADYPRGIGLIGIAETSGREIRFTNKKRRSFSGPPL